MTEIEKKFLVDKTSWNTYKLEAQLTYTEIKQGYLFNDHKITGRVRAKKDVSSGTQVGFLTLKGPTKGISRAEFEYEIPMEEVNELLTTFCAAYIYKKRYTFQFKGKIWEVDEFISPNQNLILAEIELETEVEQFDVPNFIREDVSEDEQYYNVNMLQKNSGIKN